MSDDRPLGRPVRDEDGFLLVGPQIFYPYVNVLLLEAVELFCSCITGTVHIYCKMRKKIYSHYSYEKKENFFTMNDGTFPCYAGHLCATHIGEWVQIGEHSGRLVEIRVGERWSTVMVMISVYPPQPGPIKLNLDPRQVVYASH